MPAKDGAGACSDYGLGPHVARCASCAHRTSCVKQADWWGSRYSIAEQVQELDRKLVEPVGGTFTETYEKLYAYYFGVLPLRLKSGRNRTMLSRAAQLCEKHGLEPGVYIAANMDGMSNWLSDPATNARRIKFMPNMLLGPNAQRRYNAYVLTAYRRTHAVTPYSLGPRAYDTRVWLSAYFRELDVAGDYVAGVLCGLDEPYEQVASLRAKNVAWRTIIGGEAEGDCGEVRKRITLIGGNKRIMLLRQFVRFKVAFSILESYRHGLSERIGARGDFFWKDFAILLKRLLPKRKIRTHDGLDGIPGTEWGPHVGD